MRAIAYTDGGNRQAIAASACVIVTEHGEIIEKHRLHLGSHTNNYAEYHGVILALGTAIACDIHKLDIFSDSQLVVEQIKGRYEIRTESMRPLRDRCRDIASSLETFSIYHVSREENQYADTLCNWWMDHAMGEIKQLWDRKLSRVRQNPPLGDLFPHSGTPAP